MKLISISKPQIKYKFSKTTKMRETKHEVSDVKQLKSEVKVENNHISQFPTSLKFKDNERETLFKKPLMKKEIEVPKINSKHSKIKNLKVRMNLHLAFVSGSNTWFFQSDSYNDKRE